jgi:hypothetical protein
VDYEGILEGGTPDGGDVGTFLKGVDVIEIVV